MNMRLEKQVIEKGGSMSNYNERLDEILAKLHQQYEMQFGMHKQQFNNKKIKQALTSLIKELVAEARIDELEKFVNTTNRSPSVKKLRDRLSALKSQQEEV